VGDEPVSREPSPFGDWRVRLGICLGVLVFCFGVIVWSLVDPSGPHQTNAAQAWNIVWITVVAVLGASALSDKWKK
jgi:hypothetical protein